jgi:hypothetical protein
MSGVMTIDTYVNYWQKARATGWLWHPDDRGALDALIDTDFNLRCLVGPYMGPLKTAKVIFTFINSGDGDDSEPRPGDVKRHGAIIGGEAPLPADSLGTGGMRWTVEKLAAFGLEFDEAADKVAFVNQVAYRSKTSDRLQRTLPSAVKANEFIVNTLFPLARSNERIVVVCWGARFLGLPRVHEYESLYAVKFPRKGSSLPNDENHDAAVRSVQAAVRCP